MPMTGFGDVDVDGRAEFEKGDLTDEFINDEMIREGSEMDYGLTEFAWEIMKFDAATYKS